MHLQAVASTHTEFVHLPMQALMVANSSTCHEISKLAQRVQSQNIVHSSQDCLMRLPLFCKVLTLFVSQVGTAVATVACLAVLVLHDWGPQNVFSEVRPAVKRYLNKVWLFVCNGLCIIDHLQTIFA